MKQLIHTYQNTTLYLYDWHYGRFINKWNWQDFGEQILSKQAYYLHYLEKQNASGDDVFHYQWIDESVHTELKRYSICRHSKDDNYDILNIKDLLLDWNQSTKKNTEPTPSDDAYLSHPDFRKGPIRTPRHYGRRVLKTVRTIKHTRIILNELSRLKDDDIYGCSSSKEKLMAYTIMDWDYSYRDNSRSWKDQTRKRKQWQ